MKPELLRHSPGTSERGPATGIAWRVLPKGARIPGLNVRVSGGKGAGAFKAPTISELAMLFVRFGVREVLVVLSFRVFELRAQEPALCQAVAPKSQVEL